MNNDPDNLEELVEMEKSMVLEAQDKYEDYWINAISFNDLLHNFISEIKIEGWLFVIFLSQLKKHHTLALISFVRRHQVQAQMNIRQSIEAGAAAAYALAHNEEGDFVIKKPDGTIEEPESLVKKRYSWLNSHYKKHSDFLKNQKGVINGSAAHSSVTYAFGNFDMADWKFQTSLLDKEDEFQIKLNLWFAGNLALGLLDLFYGVSKDYPLIIFKDEFIRTLKKLENENHRLKAELGKDDRIKKWQSTIEVK